MRPKDIGTRAETAVVAYLRTAGFPHAERRALAGSYDLGDVTGIPGVVVEVKAGAQTRNPSDALVTAWLAETEHEAVNARADVGLLVLQRHGVGHTRAGQWWTYLTAATLVRLLNAPVRPPNPQASIRLSLDSATALLRAAGYGTTAPVAPVAAATVAHTRDLHAMHARTHDPAAPVAARVQS